MRVPLSGRAAIGYDHGYDREVFYLGLALDPAYIEGWVEGCLERIGEDDPDEELLFGLGGRDPAGGGDRKPEGRLRGQDGKTCGSLRYRPTEIRGVFDPHPRGRYV